MGEELGWHGSSSSSSASGTAINSSNIGFQLLKKHGWKEGTGLGVCEQGRLEPVQAYDLNINKRVGLGAAAANNNNNNKLLKIKNKTTSNNKQPPPPPPQSPESSCQEDSRNSKKKPLSKKQRKMLELEKRLQEKEFERAFYREFWPDNV